MALSLEHVEGSRTGTVDVADLPVHPGEVSEEELEQELLVGEVVPSLLVVRDGRLQIALGGGERSQLGEHAPDLDPVVLVPVHVEGREPEIARACVLPGRREQGRSLCLEPRAEERWGVLRPLQRVLEPLPTLDRVSSNPPVVAHRAREPHLAVQVTRRTREVERCPDVRELGLDPIEPGRAAQPEARVVSVGELDAPLELAALDRTPRVDPVALGHRVRANGLEHVEPRLTRVACLVEDEAGVEKGLERRRDVVPRIGHGLEGIEGRAARKRGEDDPDVTRRGIEQLDTPVDRRLQRTLALGKIRRLAHEERERLAEALRGPLDAEHADTRRGQLDREREPVERPRDASERLDVRAARLEAGQRCLRPGDVEADSGGGRDLVGIGGSELRHLQRGNAVLELRADTQGNAARGKDAERRNRPRGGPRPRGTTARDARGCR